MLRVYQADYSAGWSGHDQTWIVMSDSIDNAIRQLAKKLDDDFYQIHIESAIRTLKTVRVHEIEFDEFGISKLVGHSKFYEI